MMKKSINGTQITFAFEGLAPVVFDAAKVSEANRAYAIMHGFQARIGDNAAIQKSAENGYRVTEQMRREAVLEMVGHYEDRAQTNWNLRVGTRTAKQSPAILALATKLGKTYEEAQAWFVAKLEEELTAM
jgi:hypothetical protein